MFVLTHLVLNIFAKVCFNYLQMDFDQNYLDLLNSTAEPKQKIEAKKKKLHIKASPISAYKIVTNVAKGPKTQKTTTKFELPLGELKFEQ